MPLVCNTTTLGKEPYDCTATSSARSLGGGGESIATNSLRTPVLQCSVGLEMNQTSVFPTGFDPRNHQVLLNLAHRAGVQSEARTPTNRTKSVGNPVNKYHSEASTASKSRPGQHAWHGAYLNQQRLLSRHRSIKEIASP